MSISISFKSNFRCEDVSTAGELLNAGDFIFSFDLKSGYHHVENFPGHRQYFSFSWTFSSGHTRHFHFEVLPFGISSAPYLFTKILKPLVKKLRSEGKSIIVSLDDGLGSAAGYIKAKIANLDVHSDLLKSGFIPNGEKSIWDPTHVIAWLGTVINTSECIIFATDRRIQSLTEDLLYLLASHGSLYQVRKLASVCGKIISLGNCTGSVTRLMTRNTFGVLNSAPNWNSLVSVTPECINELSFWKDNVAQINGVPLWPVKRNRQRLFTLMHPIQPAGVISNSWMKSFTKIGPISRPLRAPHFGSFLLFHFRYRRLPIPSVLKLLSGTQITRTLPAL